MAEANQPKPGSPAQPASPAETPQQAQANLALEAVAQAGQSGQILAAETTRLATGEPQPTSVFGASPAAAVVLQASPQAVNPPPVPTAINLQAQVNLLGAKVAGVQQAVATNLAATAGQTDQNLLICKQQIFYFLKGQIEALKNQCQGSYDCLRQGLANLQAQAAETAAAGGCNLVWSQEAASQAVNRLRTDGPQGLINWEGNPDPTVTAADLIEQNLRQNPGWLPQSPIVYTKLPAQPYTPQNPIDTQPGQYVQAPLGEAALGFLSPGAQPIPIPPGAITPNQQIPIPPGAQPVPLAGGVNCQLPAPPNPFPQPPITRQGQDIVPIVVPESAAIAAVFQQGPDHRCWPVMSVDGGPASVVVNPFNGYGAWQNLFPFGSGYSVSVNGAGGWPMQYYLWCSYNRDCAGGGGGGSGGGGGGGGGGSGGGGGGGPTCPVCDKPACDCSCYQDCKSKDKTPPQRWYVYKRLDGSCYVVKQSEPTEIEGDELVGEYDNETEAILTAQRCQKTELKPTEPKPPAVHQPGAGLWCSTETCLNIGEAVSDVTFVAPELPSWLAPALTGSTSYNPANDQAIVALPFLVRLPVAMLRASAYYVTGWIAAAMRGFACPQSGQPEAVYSMNAYRAFMGFLGKFIGIVADEAQIEPSYTVHALCPQRIPTSSEADSAYLTNSIDLPLWECWVRANNDCDEPRGKVIDSKRSRLGVTECVALYMRGEIDHPTYYAAMRELGFLYEAQADQYLTLANQIPPVSELIRMMTRDVADDALVQQFGLDDEFDQKWTGQLKTWGGNQGIGDLFARYEWRAHWSIPSPGQLYQMYHRLRNLPQGDPNHVDVNTIKTALAQQDILPFWQDKFIAISFNPLTRVDASRAYEVGAVSSDQLRKAYTDLGYDDENADILVNFKQRQLAVRLRTNPIVKLYEKSLIAKGVAREALLNDRFPLDLINQALDYAQLIGQSQSTAACVKSLKKRFMLGEVGAPELAGDLIELGMDDEQANRTAAAWACERAARGKLAPAATLCKWFTAGLISANDYAARLDNLGWTPEDAALHASKCQKDIDAADLKAQIQAREKQQRQQRQAIKEAEQQAAKQQREAEKLAKQALQEAKLSRKQFQRITDAAKWLVKVSGMDWITAYSQVIDAINYGLATYQLDWQAAIDAAYKAAYASSAKTAVDYPMQAQGAMRSEWLAFQTSAVDGSEVL